MTFAPGAGVSEEQYNEAVGMTPEKTRVSAPGTATTDLFRVFTEYRREVQVLGEDWIRDLLQAPGTGTEINRGAF